MFLMLRFEFAQSSSIVGVIISGGPPSVNPSQIGATKLPPEPACCYKPSCVPSIQHDYSTAPGAVLQKTGSSHHFLVSGSGCCRMDRAGGCLSGTADAGT